MFYLLVSVDNYIQLIILMMIYCNDARREKLLSYFFALCLDKSAIYFRALLVELAKVVRKYGQARIGTIIKKSIEKSFLARAKNCLVGTP